MSLYIITSHLVQVVHHPGLYHGQAELVVARARSEPHGEADGLRPGAPVSVLSSVVPQVVLSLQ